MLDNFNQKNDVGILCFKIDGYTCLGLEISKQSCVQGLRGKV